MKTKLHQNRQTLSIIYQIAFSESPTGTCYENTHLCQCVLGCSELVGQSSVRLVYSESNQLV